MKLRGTLKSGGKKEITKVFKGYIKTKATEENKTMEVMVSNSETELARQGRTSKDCYK